MKLHLTKEHYQFWFVAALILAYRLFELFSPSAMGLFFDEAQYWQWSKNLDWGYYSKPPVIAFIISLSTGLCGDETYCVRLFAPIIHVFTAFYVFRLAKLFFMKRATWLASWQTWLCIPATSSCVAISVERSLSSSATMMSGFGV